MKKRKSPIVLITILAVMASVSFGLNYAWSRSSGPGTPTSAPEVADTKTIGAPRANESKEGVSAGIKNAMGGAPQAAPTMAMEGGRGGPPGRPGAPGAPGGPMILNPSRPVSGKPEKPKLNSSSTSAQWYNKDSALGSRD